MRKSLLKVMLITLLASIGLSASAEVATLRTEETPAVQTEGLWTPLSISLITPVALPPGFWEVIGLEVGGVNLKKEMTGLQVGVVNVTDHMRGVQVGVLNTTRQAHGVQIGVVNVIADSDLPFFPIVNASV